MSAAIEFQLEGMPDFAAISAKTAQGIKAAMRSWTVNFWRLLISERLSGRPGLNRRTGNLARDWIVDIQDTGEGMQTEVRSSGAANAYAGLQEMGGTIRPTKAKYLWIPLEENQTPNGVARMTPTQAIAAGGFIDWRGPIFYLTAGKNAVGGAKKLIPYFVLKTEVKVPARMGAATLFQGRLPHLERLIAIEAAGGWE